MSPGQEIPITFDEWRQAGPKPSHTVQIDADRVGDWIGRLSAIMTEHACEIATETAIDQLHNSGFSAETTDPATFATMQSLIEIGYLAGMLDYNASQDTLRDGSA
jgi:hypothetical protein